MNLNLELLRFYLNLSSILKTKKFDFSIITQVIIEMHAIRLVKQEQSPDWGQLSLTFFQVPMKENFKKIINYV